MNRDSNFLNSYKLAYQDRTIFFKNSIMGILIVACFALGSLFFIGLLQEFTSTNLIGFCIFWVIGLSMLPILFLILPIKDFLFWNLIISASAFIPLLLSNQLSKIIWLVWVVVFLLFLFSRMVIKIEYNSLINLQWIRIVARGSIFILLGLAISLFALASLNKNTVSIEQGGIKSLDYIFSRTGIIQPFSNLQLSGTIDDILGKYIKQQTPDLGNFSPVVNQPISSEARNKVLEQSEQVLISSEARNKVLEQSEQVLILQETKLKLSEFLKYPVTGKEKLSSLIVETLKSRWQTLSSFPTTSSTWFKVGLSILIFLLILSFIKFFNIIFSIILVAISWVFLQILLSLKYLKIKRIGVEKQEITISS